MASTEGETNSMCSHGDHAFAGKRNGWTRLRARMAVGLLMALSCSAFAGGERREFDIPSQSVQKALLAFAQQAGVPILIPSKAFTDIKANRLKGKYPLEEALQILFRGTGVKAQIDQAGLLVVETTTSPAVVAGTTEGEREMAVEPRMKRSLLASAVAAIFAGTVQSVAHAQEPGAAAVEEIAVTGTRIRQTDGMTTPVPVTSMTAVELKSFDPGGTVAEQLDALPQFFSTQTAQRGGGTLYGSAGGGFLNMRGLGANRTLVLFDGSRVVPADKRGSVNVETLPMALIRTVDVVTGGASAAYGADAVGGVTNFILDRQFEGVKMEAGAGMTEWGDGERWNISLAGGRKFGDRLNVIGSVEARQIDQIQRNPANLGDWFQRYGWVTNPAWSPGAPAGVPQRLTLPWVTSSEHTPTGVMWARQGSSSNSPLLPFALNGYTFMDDGSGVRPLNHGDVYAAPNRSGSTKSMSGGPEAFNHNNAFTGGPSGREVVGRSAFLASQYEFSDTLSAFAQVLVGRSESNLYLDRGDYSLQDGWFATVFRDNAFLPPEVGAAMDAAGIDSFQLHKLGSYVGQGNINDKGVEKGVYTTYSWSVGMDALLPNGWDLRASWQSGESHKRAGVFDETRIDRLFLAMDAVRDPATGAIVCNVQLYNPTEAQLAESVKGLQSSLGGPLMSPVGLDNTIRDCVPFNVMGTGNVSREASDYVATPRMLDSVVKQDFAEALVSGELLQGWSGPISFAAGLTYREQSFADRALPREIERLGPAINVEALGIRGISPGWTSGPPDLHMFSTIPTLDGEYDVWEWFTELNIPIWQAAASSQRLDGSASYRSSEYSSIGRVESWKLGVDLQVFEDLRLRTTKSRDVREATFSERFDAGGGGGSVNDPRFNNSSFQITTITGGNPALTPEIADTLVVGAVYQPGFVPDLQLSVDWYKVEIEDAIGSLGVQRIVDECETNNVQALCAQIDRDPVTGFIGTVRNIFLNVARARVEGVDFEASYRVEPDLFRDVSESLNLRALVGYVTERSDTPPGGKPFDISGALGTPDLTANVTASYRVGAYSVQLQQRFIDSTLRNANWVEGKDVDDNTVASSTWTNAKLAYAGETARGAAWEVALNVQNLFDRNPPIIANYSSRGGSQTVDQSYDSYGRRYQLNFNYSF
ncbi:MAG TPA: TonB-dependent receptor [Hyphomicrobiales bacterium]|nr:TonB-dependent receptor [Hyphomicrobiales bacterium]